MASARAARRLIPYLVVLAVVGGCSGSGGWVRAGTATAPAPIVPPGAGGHRQGDCLDGAADEIPVPVPCDRPHTYEVTLAETVPAGTPDTYPPEVPTARPACRAALPAYVGSPDALASRIEPLYFHATEEQWAAGERWFACLVAEEGPDGRPVRRTGSLAGVLSGGLDPFRRCLSGEPVQDEPSLVVPCDQPHRSEALGALALGAWTDPPPETNDLMVNRVMPHCEAVLNTYLGGVTKPGVRVSGWAPLADSWASGATTAICYALTDTPVTGSVRDL